MLDVYQGVSRARFSLKARRKNFSFFQLLEGFWKLLWVDLYSLNCGSRTPVWLPLHMAFCVFFSVSFKDISIGFKVQPNPGWSDLKIFTLNTSARTSSHILSFWVHMSFRGHNSSHYSPPSCPSNLTPITYAKYIHLYPNIPQSLNPL